MYSVNRWLSCRFNLLSGVVVGTTALIAVLTPRIDAALAGFALAFSFNITDQVSFPRIKRDYWLRMQFRQDHVDGMTAVSITRQNYLTLLQVRRFVSLELSMVSRLFGGWTVVDFMSGRSPWNE